MRLLRFLPIAFALAGAPPATATKLDKPVCDDLKVEQVLLQQKGVAADITRGAEWGRVNLTRDRLKEIERLIHVEEQLAFRCPQPKKPLAPGEDEDGSVVAGPAKGGKAGKVGAKAASDKSPAPSKAAPPKAAQAKAAKPATNASAASDAEPPPKKKVVKAPAAPASAATTTADPARNPAPKAKPRANDAYSPPPGAAGGSPFKN